MSDTADYTARILKHYFRLAFDAVGKPWDPDYSAEIDSAVEPIRELERKVESLERTVTQLAGEHV